LSKAGVTSSSALSKEEDVTTMVVEAPVGGWNEMCMSFGGFWKSDEERPGARFRKVGDFCVHATITTT
jgi:hypothetical protein